jgi:hypothetical protein
MRENYEQGRNNPKAEKKKKEAMEELVIGSIQETPPF